MHACVLDKPAPIDARPLAWRESAEPQIAEDEVLIDVACCGVCRTDLHVVEGDLPLRKRPVVPGHQVVGRVRRAGAGVTDLSTGTRVGVAWLAWTCGECRFCASGRENLCEQAQFTGWSRDGGYAEAMTAPARFVYPLPEAMPDHAVAPLLCAGIIGYRCLRQCGLERWTNAKLGLYGFGAAGHLAIQIAKARGAEVYVCTRDRDRHQRLARDLGATWVGDADQMPPQRLDAAIIFAPAGELVPVALAALDKGGVLVLGGIHMSPTPPIDYSLLYQERVIRSVTNNTREDGRAFLREAARIGLETSTQVFPMREANQALIALKHDAVRGAAVLVNE